MKQFITISLVLLSLNGLFCQTSRDKLLKQIETESKDNKSELKSDLKDLLLNAESNTFPFNIINNMIEFSDNNDCECSLFISEIADKSTNLDDRDLLYTFNFENIKKATSQKTKDGNIISIEFYEDGKANIDIVKGSKIVKSILSDVIDIASSDLYGSETADLILEFSENCAK